MNPSVERRVQGKKFCDVAFLPAKKNGRAE